MTTENTLEVYNVVPIIRGNKVIKFITNISVKELGEVYSKLTYDENTQRGFKKVEKKSGTVEEKIMNKKNIDEMKYKMANEFFDGGVLTWNIRMDEEQNSYEYDPTDNMLTIKSSQISLPDSAQRHEAIYNVYKNGLLNTESYYFPLSISLYSLEEEQSLFSEINGKGQKANKTRALVLANTLYSNTVKNIIENTLFKGNVEEVDKNKKENVVTFGVLHDSLFDRSYGAFSSVKGTSEVKELEKWLIKFYNELLSLREEFQSANSTERRDYDKDFLTTAVAMFFGYAAVAKHLMGDPNWKSKLKRINNEYKYGSYKGDFMSKENPLWHSTLCYKAPDDTWRAINSARTYAVATTELLKYFNLGSYSVK